MCGCGCGEANYEAAYQIKGTQAVVAIDVFPGCRDCDYGPGVSVSLFDSPDNEFLGGLKPETITPDDCGGTVRKSRTPGMWSRPLFDPEDLCAEAEAITAKAGCRIGAGDDEYASLSDWLHDFGHDLLSGAIRRFEKRRRRRARA